MQARIIQPALRFGRQLLGLRNVRFEQFGQESLGLHGHADDPVVAVHFSIQETLKLAVMFREFIGVSNQRGGVVSNIVHGGNAGTLEAVNCGVNEVGDFPVYEIANEAMARQL